MNHFQKFIKSIFLLYFLVGVNVWAQNFPDRAVKFVVPTPAGISPDIVARQLGVRLEKSLGAPVVIDNKPGASGIIGADAVARAPADGYTLLYGYNQLMAINPLLFSKLAYQPSDFVPITLVARTGYLILVNPNSKINTIQDLIAAAKAKPGSITYGSQGLGTANHLSMELLSRQASIDMIHVPFSSGMSQNLMGGQIDVAVEPNGSGVGFVQGGKLKAIAVTSKERIKSLPNVPTVGETLPGYVVEGWHAIWAPKGTPKPIRDKLNKEIVEVIKSQDFSSKILDLGLISAGTTQEALDTALAEDNQKWSSIIKEKNIKLD
jgi:tripartite-type tricarboxylate transporter receptor subunit TctC